MSPDSKQSHWRELAVAVALFFLAAAGLFLFASAFVTWVGA